MIKYAQREPHVFHRRLVKGPPPVYRWVAWKVALKVKEHKVPGLYAKLKKDKENSKWLKTIKKDLDRTFPTHPLFGETSFKEKGQLALENILTAFSLYSPNVGYCQGMNFVVGFLIIMSGFKEEDAFWAFASFMRNKIPSDPIQVNGLEGLYSEGFPLLRVLQTLFRSLLNKIIPVVREHIERIDIPDVLWLHKWLSTLFIYSMPIAHCIRFWDYIFANGVSGLLRVGVAILKQLKQEILAADFPACCELFKSLKEGRGLSSAEKIIQAAEKISVDWTSCEYIRREIIVKIDQEIAERAKAVREEEAKRSVDSPPREKKQHDSGDNQRGSGEEENKPNIYLLKHRHGKLKRGLRKPRSSVKPLKAEDPLKLPPIMSGTKKQFVFETNSDAFFSEEANALSDDNGDCGDADSLNLNAPERHQRRKSMNLQLFHSAKSTKELKRYSKSPDTGLKVDKKIDILKFKDVDVASDRVFAISPKRARDKSRENSLVVASQSFYEQERGGKGTQILC